MHTNALSTSSISGTNVETRTGENIGEVKELMIDTDTGSVNYAVLSFGGVFGIGDKYFAVPFKAFDIDRTNEKFVLDVNKDRLETAPGFEKDNWPNFADPTFRTTIDNYYGTRVQ